MKCAIIILAFSIAAVDSQRIFNDEGGFNFRELGYTCAYESGLSRSDVRTLLQTLLAARKLLETAQCMVGKTIMERSRDRILDRLLNGTLPALIDPNGSINLRNTCDTLLSQRLCGNILSFANNTIHSINVIRNTLV